jgi:hypothetical protein
LCAVDFSLLDEGGDFVDIHALSLEAATVIAPYLPLLASKGALVTGKALEEIGKQIGGTAWTGVKELWEKVHPAVENSPVAKADLAAIADEQDLKKRTEALQSLISQIMTSQPHSQVQIAKAIQNISHSSNINITIS